MPRSRNRHVSRTPPPRSTRPAGSVVIGTCGLAVGLTAGLFVLKVAAEWRLEERLPRAVGALVAFLEVQFALFGIFTIDHLRAEAAKWVTARQAWEWLTGVAGPVLALWPSFQDAVLGALILLVIAGVILGLDAGDERVVLGRSRAARRLARAGGVERANSAREILTRGFREMWLPAWFDCGVPGTDADRELQFDRVVLLRTACQGLGVLALHDLPPRAEELADPPWRDGDDLLRRFQVLLDVVRLVQPLHGKERGYGAQEGERLRNPPVQGTQSGFSRFLGLGRDRRERVGTGVLGGRHGASAPIS